ncbi:hypothetical protein WJX84_002052 [Apatococcus fuscideae]|uniref:Uncharacterized protein n=1 Tax=Apatococcus fuscideae TaxID=2026836 RepID=A0AAW1STQ4_9CHLO
MLLEKLHPRATRRQLRFKDILFFNLTDPLPQTPFMAMSLPTMCPWWSMPIETQQQRLKDQCHSQASQL